MSRKKVKNPRSKLLKKIPKIHVLSLHGAMYTRPGVNLVRPKDYIQLAIYNPWSDLPTDPHEVGQTCIQVTPFVRSRISVAKPVKNH